MLNFEGFNEKTNEYLIGIRFNNYKEWFDQNRKLYKENVHEPMVLFANEVYENMNEMDNEFVEIPKVSRANRDVRFSKNKNPYKECKWFLLRADGKPDIIYDKPTFFFEISPDWWRYGFFYGPKPQTLAKFRKKVEADIAGFERLIDYFAGLEGFDMYGDMYKRTFNKELSDKINNWTQRKAIDFTHYGSFDDKVFYTNELVDVVFEGYKKLYPLFKYFNAI